MTGGTVPAAGRFTPVGLYDAIVARTMRERQWRGRLAADAVDHLDPAATITEVGAGTGSLTVVLAGALPGAAITAVEPDERALAIARGKPGGQDVAWRDGRAERLPLDAASQDAVVMALMLHHLEPAAKHEALREARRVLRPGGILYIADFVRPQDPLMAAAFAVVQLADGRAATAAHRRGALPSIVAAAGFTLRERVLALRTGLGSLEVLSFTAGSSPAD